MSDTSPPPSSPPPSSPLSAEHRRLAESALDHPGAWKAIGPYLSERAWGTVREDYSADGKAWGYFPYEHGRSRAYRWSEDGLAGVCDRSQTLCFALSLWNGRDPFLKERLFGLSGPEGNHGEDVKEYWWYADATPTASWLSWLYHYPQAEFPYAQLRRENARRARGDREYELVLATYDLVAQAPALHFHLDDPLGTRRMQLPESGRQRPNSPAGQPETDIQSMPYGDQLYSFPDQYAPDRRRRHTAPFHRQRTRCGRVGWITWTLATTGAAWAGSCLLIL